MKIKSLIKIAVGLISSFALFGLVGLSITNAATSPSLGSASTYGVVSDTFTNSNTPPQTIINGAVCYTTPPVTVPLTITGATDVPCAPVVGTDLGLALANLNGQACTSLGGGAVALNSIIIGANPAGTFPPGCYSSGGAMNITLGTTVTLNGVGTYIFRSGGALNTGDNSNVVLTGGANAADVFWVPTGLATIGANAAPTLVTPTFVGNIIDAAGITIGHFANLLGRALAFGGTVTTDADTISVPPPAPVPATLHVIKLVVGGAATSSDFTLHVKLAGSDVVGSPSAGTSTPGTTYSLLAGTYAVSEDSSLAYTPSFINDCDLSGNITLLAGQDKTCTIINTAIPVPVAAPSSGGGSSIGGSTGGGSPVVTRFIPLIGVVKVPSPLNLPNGAGPVTYNYNVWNVGGEQALTDVTVTDDKCDSLTLVSGDLNNNHKLDIDENWKYQCSLNLSTTTTNTAIATGYSDDSYHQATVATAIAKVVVGVKLTPPLIDIVKVPSQLTPLPFGGGNVTYTYTVTNPGLIALHNVTVSDDKCFAISNPTGDANGNTLLDTNETWAYTCKTNITFTTANTATAKGVANGFTATDYAFATVLVSTPGLPNTGLPTSSNLIIPAVVLLLILIALVLILKKRKTA